MALAAAGVVVVVASQATPRAPRVNCGLKGGHPLRGAMMIDTRAAEQRMKEA